ncbi:MAG: response regulator [Lysobacterales bacterium]
MCDDDPDDRYLFKEALRAARVDNHIDFTVDGEDLMEFLHGTGRYVDDPERILPDLILLDLNMPKKDGTECLREIRSHEKLKHIPVVVLTTSKAHEDVLKSYQLGVNSFVQKPVEFPALVDVVTSLTEYWIKFIRLPRQDAAQD